MIPLLIVAAMLPPAAWWLRLQLRAAGRIPPRTDRPLTVAERQHLEANWAAAADNYHRSER